MSDNSVSCDDGFCLFWGVWRGFICRDVDGKRKIELRKAKFFRSQDIARLLSESK